MHYEKAYYMGTHHCSFRSGEAAEIIGVEMVQPDGKDFRACYRVRYGDGKEEIHPVLDHGNYTIKRAGEVRPALIAIVGIQTRPRGINQL